MTDKTQATTTPTPAIQPPIDLSWFGKTIEINKSKDKTEAWDRYVIMQVASTTCKTDAGGTTHYVHCPSITDPKVFLNLHPEYLAKIIAGTDTRGRVVETDLVDVPKTADGLPTIWEAPAKPKATKPAAKKAAKKPAKKADKKAAATEPPAEGAAETTTAEATPATGKKGGKKEAAAPETKADKARAIYAKMLKAGKGRSDIIKAFMADLSMSQAGASTYYYNIKSKA